MVAKRRDVEICQWQLEMIVRVLDAARFVVLKYEVATAAFEAHIVEPLLVPSRDHHHGTAGKHQRFRHVDRMLLKASRQLLDGKLFIIKIFGSFEFGVGS
jgi:hypothetical protein